MLTSGNVSLFVNLPRLFTNFLFVLISLILWVHVDGPFVITKFIYTFKKSTHFIILCTNLDMYQTEQGHQREGYHNMTFGVRCKRRSELGNCYTIPCIVRVSFTLPCPSLPLTPFVAQTVTVAKQLSLIQSLILLNHVSLLLKWLPPQRPFIVVFGACLPAWIAFSFLYTFRDTLSMFLIHVSSPIARYSIIILKLFSRSFSHHLLTLKGYDPLFHRFFFLLFFFACICLSLIFLLARRRKKNCRTQWSSIL